MFSWSLHTMWHSQQLPGWCRKSISLFLFQRLFLRRGAVYDLWCHSVFSLLWVCLWDSLPVLPHQFHSGQWRLPMFALVLSIQLHHLPTVPARLPPMHRRVYLYNMWYGQQLYPLLIGLCLPSWNVPKRQSMSALWFDGRLPGLQHGRLYLLWSYFRVQSEYHTSRMSVQLWIVHQLSGSMLEMHSYRLYRL